MTGKISSYSVVEGTDQRDISISVYNRDASQDDPLNGRVMEFRAPATREWMRCEQDIVVDLEDFR